MIVARYLRYFLALAPLGCGVLTTEESEPAITTDTSKLPAGIGALNFGAGINALPKVSDPVQLNATDSVST